MSVISDLRLEHRLVCICEVLSTCMYGRLPMSGASFLGRKMIHPVHGNATVGFQTSYEIILIAMLSKIDYHGRTIV